MFTASTPHCTGRFRRILRKRAALSVVLACATLCAGSVYYRFAPRVYHSRAIISIGSADDSSTPVPSDTSFTARLLAKRLHTPRLIEATAGELGLSGSAREIALKHVHQTVIRQTNARGLEVQIWCSSEKLAAEWVQTLVQNYNASERTKYFNAPPSPATELDRGSPNVPAEAHLPLRFERMLHISNGPVSPRLRVVILATLIATLLTGGGGPLLVEALRRTIPDLQRGEALLRLPGLAVLPQFEEPSKRSAFLTGDDSVWRDAREIMEPLRARLFMQNDSTHRSQVVLMTSARRKEGKTITAIQMALACAGAGKKTLLIDADVENGDLHRLFGYRAGPGVTDVIDARSLFEEACRKTMFENLTVLPLGLETRPSAEQEVDFASWGAALRDEFECVIVDGCALLDGQCEWAVRIADAVALVVAEGRTPLAAVCKAVALLRGQRALLAGFMLNRGHGRLHGAVNRCPPESDMTLIQVPC